MFSKIILKKGKEQSLRRFHPWVFSGAIQRTEGEVHDGDIVQVVSSDGKYLGTGHAADGSIAVRIFSFDQSEINSIFWFNKIERAYQLRRKLHLVDNPATTMYRLVHAEGDGLPGLIIDIYGSVAVIQCHSVGMYLFRSEIAKALVQVYGNSITAVYDKSSAKLNKGTDTEYANEYLYGSSSDDYCLENGSKFYVDWEEGQKTGFFIDQRDNRKLLGHYSAGKKVLNTFCYTGGFSMYALQAGAQLVHSLDSSQSALDLTEKNRELNGFSTTTHACIKADAVEYIKQLPNDYDIIVLDPPAFAKHLSARHKAVQGYLRINEAAFRQIKSGGLVFTFSCSQVVDKQLFNHTIAAAAINAGRSVKVLHQLHQPADHPVSIFHPEGEYLKGLVLEVS